MGLRCCVVLLAAAAAGTGAAATFSFRNGPLALTFDETTGAMVRIAHGKTVLAKAPPDRSPTAFAVGPKDKVRWLDEMGLARKLLMRTQPTADALELTVRAGDFELVERYRLDPKLPRLDRSATLIHRGKQAVKLRGFAFRTPGVLAATPDGVDPDNTFYRFPCTWPPAGHRFADMTPGRKRGGGGGSIAPLLIQLSRTRCLLWATLGTDSPSVHVTEGKGRLEVGQGLEAAGYLRPGKPQHIGAATMQVVDAAYWDALPALWDWMDGVGIKVPADRPEWVQDALLYSFHPGGTIGSGFRDLGGFKSAAAKLLPTVAELGCTAVWIMPVEQRSPYWPFDYYRFMDGLGTGDDYHALVRRAHGLGLHVLQDLVPHGGSPDSEHNKRHPEFMLRREDGSHLSYWLNDFALPAWQAYVAKVAAHYVEQYGVDGYRVDACYGSKELNWNPAVPYARASLSRLAGGLGMLRAIRAAVKKHKPAQGAILAETESARHLAESDADYDFSFCYRLCHEWRRRPAAQFVAHLRDYLEEQQHTVPRGAIRLRHIESHDSLRAQLWYGVRGMEAMYALSAWIHGMPLVYHEMEHGHSVALRHVNETRRIRPELSRGQALYRAVRCDQPAVFTCLRKLEDRTSVLAINFGREPVKANLTWPGGGATLRLDPLDYTLVPRPANQPARVRVPPERAAGRVDGGHVAFPDAREWFVDTLEGRLHDEFRVRHTAAPPHKRSSIYWRPQGADAVWQNEMAPLHPGRPRLGVLGRDGTWTLLTFDGPVAENVRLVERLDDTLGLHLVGLGTLRPRRSTCRELPPPPPAGQPIDLGGATLRCVGPDYIVGNRHYTVALRRQGGVVRELVAGDTTLCRDHDLYGDQAYFALRTARRIAASNDVENAIRIWRADDGLHLRFEGQLRGFQRFALKRPPLWFRNEYVFTGDPSFRQRFAFRTEKTFENRTAFLAAFLLLPDSDGFRFLREGKTVAQDVVGDGGPRRGQTRGNPPPDRVEFLRKGKAHWGLVLARAPRDFAGNVFVHRRQFFITLLDGKGSSMEQGRWHEFEASWRAGAG